MGLIMKNILDEFKALTLIVKDKEEFRRVSALLDKIEIELKTMDAINKLREPEGAKVTICCDNPDFNNLSNNIITVVDGWTNWMEYTYSGNNLLEALNNALQNRKEITGA